MSRVSDAGIAFDERMAGALADGEVSPFAEASRAGAGRPCELFARVTIPSVRRFLDDPDHRCELEGHVRLGASGDLPIRDGLVQLFVPSTHPDLKLMVYRFAFTCDAAEYCLDGRKEVRRRSVFRSWHDTTTLLCRLHAGTDPRSPVVAAGVLRLTAADFSRQLASFRTLNAGTALDSTRALAGFGTFFARELLDTYFGSRAPA